MLVAFVATTAAGLAAATSYVYDANGRLIVVTNSSGNSARYRYDALGNVTQVERLSAGQLAIFDFSPGRGAAGTEVQIEGQGFSSTPSQNSVSFNGTPASVLSATSSSISAIVPTVATTGPIAVTVGAQSAASIEAFVVDENVGPPLIEDVSPSVAAIGTLVTVEGQRLEPINDRSVLKLNGRVVQSSSAIDTEVEFSVPSGVGSGRVSITSPFGTGTSIEDLLVLPADLASAQISHVSRINIGAVPQSFSVNDGNQHVAIMFDGAAGDHLSLQFASLTAPSAGVRLYGVNNALLASPSVSPTSLTAHLPRLPATGTYLVVVKPSMGPASWDMAIERAIEIIPDQNAAPVSIAIPGQSKRLVTHVGTLQGLGIGASNLVMSAGSQANLVAYGPTGASLANSQCYLPQGQCDINLYDLMPGAHTLVVTPAESGQTVSLDVTLSNERRLHLQRHQVQAVSLNRVGQNGRLQFAAVAGERLEIRVQSQTTLPAATHVYYSVYKPDGSFVISRSTSTPAALHIESAPLSGTYELVVDPSIGARTELSVELVEPVTETILIGGPSIASYAPLPGQVVELKFDASAGQNLGLGVSNVQVTGPSGPYIFATVYGPGGTYLFGQGSCWAGNGCDLNFTTSSAGEHLIRFSTFVTNGSLAFTATLSEDLEESLVSGERSTLKLDRHGKNGRASFSAAVGETLLLQIASSQYGDAYYRVYRPDGQLLTTIRSSSVKTLELAGLPMTGDYLIFIDPVYGRSMTTHLTIDDQVLADMAPNGVGISHPQGVPGEGGYFSFSAQAGDSLGLGISELQMGSDPYASSTVTVLSEAGAYIDSTPCYANQGGCDFDLQGLSGGVYHVFVDPGSNMPVGFKATLSSELTEALAPNTPQTISIQRDGQDARLSFSAAANESLAIRITGLTTSHSSGQANFMLTDPNGDAIMSESFSLGRTIYLTDYYPSISGVYELHFDPEYGATANLQVTLLEDISLSTSGPSRAFTSAGMGDIGMFELSIGTGERLTLDVGSIVTTGTTSAARLRLYRPDGSYVSKQCAASATECSYDLSTYGVGLHRLEVEPPTNGAGTVSFLATLSNEAQDSLQDNVPELMNIARPGQSARYEFAVVAGVSLTMVISDIQTSPSGRTLKYTVRNPNGSVYRGPINATSSTVINFPSPAATGTYLLDVDLPSGTTSQFRVEQNTGGTLTVGGAAVPYTSGVSWERSYLSFTVASTGNRRLRTNQLATPGTTNPARIEVHRPDGTTSTFQNCTAGTATCTFTLNSLAPGKYGVVVHPPAGGNGTMSFNQTLGTQ
ncbi:MAG: IPT/TIG domain-containing protein [Pseudoxanthomonas sp.]|nr:IPT/TIG domain-containing protein [Pseudoxanthomonas sp.]